MLESSMINNSIFTKIDKEIATVFSCHCHLTPSTDPLNSQAGERVLVHPGRKGAEERVY